MKFWVARVQIIGIYLYLTDPKSGKVDWKMGRATRFESNADAEIAAAFHSDSIHSFQIVDSDQLMIEEIMGI